MLPSEAYGYWLLLPHPPPTPSNFAIFMAQFLSFFATTEPATAPLPLGFFCPQTSTLPWLPLFSCLCAFHLFLSFPVADAPCTSHFPTCQARSFGSGSWYEPCWRGLWWQATPLVISQPTGHLFPSQKLPLSLTHAA